jgi:hypothetical protein
MITDQLGSTGQELLAAEHKVEVDSAALKRELRLVDLVGIQILFIMGLSWVGTAGKLGPGHVLFWVAATILFYIPSGIVVAHLVTGSISGRSCGSARVWAFSSG